MVSGVCPGPGTSIKCFTGKSYELNPPLILIMVTIIIENIENVRNPPQNGTDDRLMKVDTTGSAGGLLEDIIRNRRERHKVFNKGEQDSIKIRSRVFEVVLKWICNYTLSVYNKGVNRMEKFCCDLIYEVTRSEESDSQRYDQFASNLISFEQELAHRTPYMQELDAVLKEKFGIPKLSNQESNNAAMAAYLSRYISSHNPTMRRVDEIQHINAAITRAYIPTRQDSKLAAIRRSDVYQTLNGNYHGEKDLQSAINSRIHSKWTRIKWLLTGKPHNRNFEKVETAIMKEHSIEHTPYYLEEHDAMLPVKFGQVDPYYRQQPNTTILDEDDAGDTVVPLPIVGPARAPNNTDSGELITTLDQC